MISDSIVPVVLCRRFIIWEGRDIIPCPKPSSMATSQVQSIIDSRLTNTLVETCILHRERCRKAMYISTDGRTVWLHVRIEDNPKYYKYSL
jgi:hypothetical protein